MLVAWRLTKTRHDPWDGTGAMRLGARWDSPGRSVIYASDTFAGAILQILAHALRPRTLPGAHHAIRIAIPDEIVERIDDAAVPGWETRDSEAALDYGDRWHRSRRSAVLLAPALPSRPVGRSVLINPHHGDVGRIERSAPFAVAWDERLF